MAIQRAVIQEVSYVNAGFVVSEIPGIISITNRMYNLAVDALRDEHKEKHIGRNSEGRDQYLIKGGVVDEGDRYFEHLGTIPAITLQHETKIGAQSLADFLILPDPMKALRAVERDAHQQAGC